MKAARLHEYGHPLILEDIPAPRPGRGQVVVRVVGAGFCHRDIALVESGQLTSIPIEVAPLERINEVYTRLKRGDVQGRAVIEPAA